MMNANAPASPSGEEETRVSVAVFIAPLACPSIRDLSNRPPGKKPDDGVAVVRRVRKTAPRSSPQRRGARPGVDARGTLESCGLFCWSRRPRGGIARDQARLADRSQ